MKLKFGVNSKISISIVSEVYECLMTLSAVPVQASTDFRLPSIDKTVVLPQSGNNSTPADRDHQFCFQDNFICSRNPIQWTNLKPGFESILLVEQFIETKKRVPFISFRCQLTIGRIPGKNERIFWKTPLSAIAKLLTFHRIIA